MSGFKLSSFNRVFLLASVALSTSAFASAEKPSVCEIYSDYVMSQCVSPSALQTSTELKQNYSVADCRKESFEMILETDDSAKEQCEITPSVDIGSVLLNK